MRHYLAFVAAAGLVAAGCQHPGVAPTDYVQPTAAVASERQELVKKLDEIFDDPDFERAFWGVKIKSLDTGEVWYERNPEKLFLPASNQKIPTTAAALMYLGPDFQFETELKYRGEIQDGTLVGDLVVKGHGDPTKYDRFFETPLDVFIGWAEKLKEAGIERIEGDIIGDESAWDDERIRWTWPQPLSPWYYAEFGPLVVNENYVDFEIVPPDSLDGEVQIIPNLPSNYYTVINNVAVVASGSNSISFNRERGTNIIEFSGHVVAGSSSFERTPTITDPTAFYVTVLKETLEAHGIEVAGEPIPSNQIPNWEHNASEFTMVDVHRSAPLLEILAMLMKRSQNMFAENMVQTMGWKATGKGTYSAGRQVIYEQMDSIGVPRDSYIYSDGSGLSRYNYLSPEGIIAMQEGMYHHDLWEEWYYTYPIGGVDGTIRSRFRGEPAENNVRAKTGTISNTRALSGYVHTAAGELLTFAMLVNSHQRPAAAVNGVTDPAVNLLADYAGN